MFYIAADSDVYEKNGFGKDCSNGHVCSGIDRFFICQQGYAKADSTAIQNCC